MTCYQSGQNCATFPACAHEKAKPSTPAALYELAALERGEALKTIVKEARNFLMGFEFHGSTVVNHPSVEGVMRFWNIVKEAEAKL